VSAWPWPGDSTLDRSRRVARSYRDALQRADPNGCEALDALMVERFGQTWLAPTVATLNGEDWVTVSEAATLVGLTPAAVYKWVHRRWLKGHIGADRRLVVKIADVLSVNQEQRLKRASRNSTA
jgi:hypothetical protein